MNFAVGEEREGGYYWTIVADIAVSLFLVFILFLVLQHVRSVEVVLVNQILMRRQHALAESLQEVLRAQPGDSAAVRIESIAPDRQRLRFSTDVLFRTCGTELRREGNEILRRAGEVLRHEGLEAGYLESIRVDGHTDVRPTGGENCPYTSNWELSTMRATAVVHLLENEAGIPGAKLSATGQAQYHPVAESMDPVSLALNRRIEITIQYDHRNVLETLRADSSERTSARS
ncbi:MAG: OmpA/MotB family protein [Gammaproteobacteria bacterium]